MLALWSKIRKFVLELHAWIALIGAIFIAFAAAVAAMSWVTNSITALAAYGWGVPVLVAMGIVLVVVMGLGFVSLPVAKAWRAYRPLPLPPLTPPLETTAEIEPSPDIGRLERQMELLRLSLPPLERQSEELKADIGRLNQLQHEVSESFRGQFIEQQKKLMVLGEAERLIGADIKRLNEVGVTQHGVTEYIRGQLTVLQGTVKALGDDLTDHKGVVARGTRQLIRALRARDAMKDVLEPNDQTVMSLGGRLMYPESYSGPEPWLADYRAWREALKTIDDLMLQWTREQHPNVYGSLFDLKEHHYDQAPMPPPNISSDVTVIAFKTVCLVQPSYANQRAGIRSFFEEKIVYPG